MKTKFLKSVLLLIISLTLFSCSSDSNDTPAPTPEPPKTKVFVTRIDISQIATLDSNGVTWDLPNNPDIYIKLFDETNTLGYTSNHVNNALPTISNPLTLSFLNLSTTNLTTGQLKVQLWDNDLNDVPSNADDFMGEVPFYINDYTIGSNKYPAYAVKNVNGNIVTIFMTWQ